MGAIPMSSHGQRILHPNPPVAGFVGSGWNNPWAIIDVWGILPHPY
jgi:hypothetical protein